MDTKKRISEKLVPNFNFIKLNEDEYTNFDSYIKILRYNRLIVTLGSKGAKYMDELFPSNDPKETIDVSGAGDTFTASFTLSIWKLKILKNQLFMPIKWRQLWYQKEEYQHHGKSNYYWIKGIYWSKFIKRIKR
jgi:sugar/nucleoside kinase (ribokinase family)